MLIAGGATREFVHTSFGVDGMILPMTVTTANGEAARQVFLKPAADFVAFGLKGGKDQKRARVEELLTKVDLMRFIDGFPHQLSGGEQQRVAIARAMVKSAKILFADEPTGSLDRKTGEEIMNLIEEINDDGLTVVMVTHEPDYANRAGRVVELSDGAIA